MRRHPQRLRRLREEGAGVEVEIGVAVAVAAEAVIVIGDGGAGVIGGDTRETGTGTDRDIGKGLHRIRVTEMGVEAIQIADPEGKGRNIRTRNMIESKLRKRQSGPRKRKLKLGLK